MFLTWPSSCHFSTPGVCCPVMRPQVNGQSFATLCALVFFSPVSSVALQAGRNVHRSRRLVWRVLHDPQKPALAHFEMVRHHRRGSISMALQALICFSLLFPSAGPRCPAKWEKTPQGTLSVTVAPVCINVSGVQTCFWFSHS